MLPTRSIPPPPMSVVSQASYSGVCSHVNVRVSLSGRQTDQQVCAKIPAPRRNAATILLHGKCTAHPHKVQFRSQLPRRQRRARPPTPLLQLLRSTVQTDPLCRQAAPRRNPSSPASSRAALSGYVAVPELSWNIRLLCWHGRTKKGGLRPIRTVLGK